MTTGREGAAVLNHGSAGVALCNPGKISGSAAVEGIGNMVLTAGLVEVDDAFVSAGAVLPAFHVDLAAEFVVAIDGVLVDESPRGGIPGLHEIGECGILDNFYLFYVHCYCVAHDAGRCASSAVSGAAA